MQNDTNILMRMFSYRQTGLQSKNQTNCFCMKTPAALPLSKTTKLNTSTNDTTQTCRMRYAQQVATFGPTASSTSYPRKTCSVGGPTFSY